MSKINKEVEKVINKYLSEDSFAGGMGSGLATNIVKFQDSPITQTIKEYIKAKFPEFKIKLFNVQGENCTLNLEYEISGVSEFSTGLMLREKVKEKAVEFRNDLNEYLQGKFSVTDVAIGGIDVNGNMGRILIQFFLRNKPVYQVMESYLREDDNFGYGLMSKGNGNLYIDLSNNLPKKKKIIGYLKNSNIKYLDNNNVLSFKLKSANKFGWMQDYLKSIQHIK